MYRVVVERSAEKDLRKLPLDMQLRVAHELRSLPDDARPAASSLEPNMTGGFESATIVSSMRLPTR